MLQEGSQACKHGKKADRFSLRASEVANCGTGIKNTVTNMHRMHAGPFFSHAKSQPTRSLPEVENAARAALSPAEGTVTQWHRLTAGLR